MTTQRRNAKLTPGQVLEIREKYWQQGYTQSKLSREYRVSVAQIGKITRGEAWQDFGGVGYHKGANEAPAEQRLREAAEDVLIMQSAPAVQDQEIQASLARLMGKLETNSPPVPTGDCSGTNTQEKDDGDGEGGSAL